MSTPMTARFSHSERVRGRESPVKSRMASRINPARVKRDPVNRNVGRVSMATAIPRYVVPHTTHTVMKAAQAFQSGRCSGDMFSPHGDPADLLAMGLHDDGRSGGQG